MSELVGTLLKKFKCTEKGLTETALVYDGLADSLNVQSVREWNQQERQAMEERGDLLRIYDLKLEKGKFWSI